MSSESDDSTSSSLSCESFQSTEYEIDLSDIRSYMCGILRPSQKSGSGYRPSQKSGGEYRPSQDSGGGVKEIGSLSLTYGSYNQAYLSGKYSGVQCTTMALAAIIHNTAHPKWSPKKINTILTEGNRLHTFLRDQIKLSANTDGKIAVEDIPFNRNTELGHVFGKQTTIKLKRECQNVFTSTPEGFEKFLTINEYLEKQKPTYTNRCGFLITIGQSSYAIILKKKGTAALFDSHGHLKIDGKIIKEKAGVLKFPSIQSLHEFILSMYGPKKQAVIAPVHVSFVQKKSEENVGRKAGNERHEYKPYIPEEENIAEGAEFNRKQTEDTDDDFSPYIGMFGGG